MRNRRLATLTVIDGHYKLDEVPKAFRYFGEGAHKGKVVIAISPSL